MQGVMEVVCSGKERGGWYFHVSTKGGGGIKEEGRVFSSAS